jgi:hypothetical protein
MAYLRSTEDKAGSVPRYTTLAWDSVQGDATHATVGSTTDAEKGVPFPYLLKTKIV